MTKRFIPHYPVYSRRRLWLERLPAKGLYRGNFSDLVDTLKKAKRSLGELGFRVYSLLYTHGRTHPLNFLARAERPGFTPESQCLLVRIERGKVVVRPLQRPECALYVESRRILRQDAGTLLEFSDVAYTKPTGKTFRWQQLVLRRELSKADAAMAR